MAAPFDNNAVSIYGQYAQFELLASGSSAPAASGSAVRVFASASKLWMVRPDEDHKEIATTSDGLDYSVQDGDGIADFTFDGSANATVSVDINGLTQATGVADADEVMIYDASAGALRKMTRAHLIESAALDSIDIDGGAIDGTPIGANSAAAGTFTTLIGSTVSGSGAVSGFSLDIEQNADIDGTLDVAGQTDLNGDVNLGNATSDTITATGRFDSDLVPSSDSAQDLGSSALQWAELHVDTGHIDALGSAMDCDSQAMTNINVDSGAIDGVTIGTNSAATQVVATQLTASALKVSNDLLVVGDLQVQGNLDSVSVTQNTLEVSDYLIIAGNSGSAANMDAGGYQFGGTKLGSDAVASMLWDNSNSSLDFNIGSTTEVRLQDGVFRPETDNDVDLGASGAEFKDLYLDGVAYIDELQADQLGAALDANSQNITNVGTFEVDGAATFNGDIDLGDATSDTVTVTARFDSDLVPSTDSARDLGTSALQWAELHVDMGYMDQLGAALDANSQNITNVGTFEVDGAATFNGNVTLGDASSDVVTFTGQVTASAPMMVADDQGLYFGSDSDSAISYDEANSNTLVISGSATGITAAGAFSPLYDDTYDLGNSSQEWKDLYLDGVAYIDEAQIGQLGAALDANSQAITNINVDSGAIDGTTIGANSAANGTFLAVAGTTADFSSTLNADGNATFNGDVDLGNATSDTITATGRFDSDLVPSTDSARDLGTSALQFRTAYVDEVESATGVLTLTTAAGIAVAGTANSSGYLLELPTDGDARARAWVTYSSARHKTNVQAVQNPIETVKSLRGVTYDWKGTGQPDVGFIAEEVGAIVPEVVSFGKDGRAEGIDYGRLTSVLVEAMKAQQVEIEKLQSVMKNLTTEQPSLLEDKQFNYYFYSCRGVYPPGRFMPGGTPPPGFFI